MSDYSRQWDFSTLSGSPILGSNVDDEFDELVTVIATKVDESREGAASGIATLTASSVLPAGISGNATSGGGQLPEASATNLGAVELATTAEITTGTDPLRVITVAELKTHLDTQFTASAGVGLSESGRVLAVDLNELTTDTAILSAEFVAVYTDGSKKITLANFATSLASVLNHDSLSGFVANEHIDHSSVSITAGNGLTGGGTIAATRTINVGAGTGISVAADTVAVDFSGVTNIEGNVLQPTDSFAVNDGGVLKQIDYQDMGFRVQSAQTSQTLAAADMNTIMEFDTTATLTIPLNSTTALPVGSMVIIVNDNASTQVSVTAAASVTLNSVNHAGGATAATDKVSAGGTACLIKTATNEWYLSGNIVD